MREYKLAKVRYMSLRYVESARIANEGVCWAVRCDWRPEDVKRKTAGSTCPTAGLVGNHG